MGNKDKLTIIKISIAILVGIAGLLTFIFAILKLSGGTKVSSDIVIRILLGIVLLIIGTSTSLFTIFSNSASKTLNVVIAGLCIGIGIYCFFNDSSAFLTQIVAFIIPLIIASVGGLMLIKAIVDGIRKTNNTFIFSAVLGAVLLTGGIVIAVFHNNANLIEVIWLLLGLAIIAASIGAIIFTLKSNKPKAKIIENPTNK